MASLAETRDTSRVPESIICQPARRLAARDLPQVLQVRSLGGVPVMARVWATGFSSDKARLNPEFRSSATLATVPCPRSLFRTRVC